jgi:hypothetical protein
MHKKAKPDRTLLHFMLRAQQIAQQDGRSDRGYAMLIVSLVSIAMFSMLAAYMTMTNLSKSSTDAYTKGTSTFYAAESGLNARAQLIRQKVGSYEVPIGLSASSINACWTAASTDTIQYDHSFGTSAINDFGCKNYTFTSRSGSATDLVVGGNNGSLTTTKVQTPDNYIATTYVVDNPDNMSTYPKQTLVPTGDLFEGMRMLEYTQRVYSTARVQTANSATAPAQTVLQLDFQTRFIPMFQFAVFYDQDLEITPGPSMNINGRVHTNGNLYLADGSGSTLCLAGQVSAQGKIYNRRKHAGNSGEQTSNGLVYIYPNAGTCTPTLTQVAANKLYNSVTYTSNPDPNTTSSSNYDSTNQTNKVARFGTSNVLDGVKNIKVPSPDFLAKTGSGGALSVYYTKADVRIEMKSNPTTNAIPFKFTSIASGMGSGTGCGGFDVATDRAGSGTIRCMAFSAGQLHSLRQPVLVRTGQSTDDTTLCTAELTGITAATSSAITALTTIQKKALTRALQTAIVSQKDVLKYSDIKTKTPNDFPNVSTLFGNYLTSSGITTVTAASLSGKKFTEIAAISGDCFKSAPIQKYNTFYNNRERANLTANSSGGNITMLQTNIESLTIWNRDGLYVNLKVDAAGDPDLDALSKYQVDVNGDNNGQGNSAYQQIFQLAAIPSAIATCNTTDNLCKKSFRHLGLAGADTSERGFVFHMTVDNNNTPGTTTAYTAKKSPYGFAITGGKQLPNGLTLATDQAAYLQGDYNFLAGTGQTGTGTNYTTLTTNPATLAAWTIGELSNAAITNGGYKYPASILADSVNVTSDSCLDADVKLNCGVNGSAPAASNTTINAAFLGGSDIMPFSNANNYSGGWHNYPRFHENWGGSLNYKGSFVSLGAPLQVSGTWDQTIYDPPTRNWDYDTDFNNVNNLPPLTPNIVYLKQNVFMRSYSN